MFCNIFNLDIKIYLNVYIVYTCKNNEIFNINFVLYNKTFSDVFI